MKPKIYRLGRHRLMCGDSTNQDHVAQLLDGEQARLLVCDPPYFLGKDSWDKFSSVEHYSEFTHKWLDNALKAVSPEAHHSFVFSSQRHLALILQILAGKSIEIKSILIWHYRNLANKFKQPRCGLKKTYDPIIHFGNRPINLPKPLTDICFDVWTIATPQRNYKEGRIHPTQKPLKLIERMILLASHKGEIVLDLFGGSGTSLIAADRLGRICYLIEKDPGYCTQILERWSSYAAAEHEFQAEPERQSNPASTPGAA